MSRDELDEWIMEGNSLLLHLLHAIKSAIDPLEGKDLVSTSAASSVSFQRSSSIPGDINSGVTAAIVVASVPASVLTDDSFPKPDNSPGLLANNLEAPQQIQPILAASSQAKSIGPQNLKKRPMKNVRQDRMLACFFSLVVLFGLTCLLSANMMEHVDRKFARLSAEKHFQPYLETLTNLGNKMQAQLDFFDFLNTNGNKDGPPCCADDGQNENHLEKKEKKMSPSTIEPVAPLQNFACPSQKASHALSWMVEDGTAWCLDMLCYTIVQRALSQADAEALANKRGGELARVHSDVINAKIAEVASKNKWPQDLWIAGERSKSGWVFPKTERTKNRGNQKEEEEKLSFTNWASYEPNGFSFGENCIHMIVNRDSPQYRKWNDRSCLTELQFVMQFPNPF